MPIYEYACPRCGHLFEKFQSIQDSSGANCQQCGRPAKRMISRSSFVLRGTGWYATDYRNDKNRQELKKQETTTATHKK